MQSLLIAQPRRVFPVVHYLDYGQAYSQASLALVKGADGVFLISHRGQDAELLAPAQDLKKRFPEKFVGINFLSLPADKALEFVLGDESGPVRLDGLWVDAPGVTSVGMSPTGTYLGQLLYGHSEFERFCSQGTAEPLELFASVAFKYQPPEPDPATAAIRATQAGMIATTSGAGTGNPPALSKVTSMREALDEFMIGQLRAPRTRREVRLAVASGMTPDNVSNYLPYVTDYLVSTGISKDDHFFDEDLLMRFIQLVHGTR